MNLFRRLFRIKPPKIIERLSEIQTELLAAQESIQKLAKLDISYDLENRLLSSALNGLYQNFWTKDQHGKILYANRNCLENVLKIKSLEDLKEDFEVNSLALVCAKSDKLVLGTGEIKHFIECGYVKGEYVALDTIKSPFFQQGEITGTIGSGLLVTELVPDQLKIRNYLFELSLTGYFSEEKLNQLFDGYAENLMV